MINAIEAKLPNLTVPFRAFRILVGEPFHSVPFRSLVTTLGTRLILHVCRVLLISELHPVCTTIAPRVLHFSTVHYFCNQ